MMHDPFKITDNTCISFSGGRTSAYMLWRVLQSNGGLPDCARIVFGNTGKEEEETLRFVMDVSEKWGVPITWVEYRYTPDAEKKHGFEVVTFETASRNGEPFEMAIRAKQYLPNPVTRFCSYELKVRSSSRFLKSVGWTEWDNFIGIRADEQRRVAKFRVNPNPNNRKETVMLPLADAGITVRDVSAFWEKQNFDLGLVTTNGKAVAGNCDLCFLKGAKQTLSLIAQRPSRADWWIKMESLQIASKQSGDRFRKDRPSYAEMKLIATDQSDLFGIDDPGIDCFCGD
jgi:3'-phosphoadenosine 5'-phosphosulfate sulfotransferase (PAPS reductase)/FAD synthetase